MRDETTPYEQTYIPTSIRLEIPLKSVVNLRRVAGELRALALSLDFISRNPSLDPPEALNAARTSCYRTRKNIEKISPPGRPKKRVHSLRW